MKLAKQLQKLGTETAFAVSAVAAEWGAKGHKIYPFHLGDINIATPGNIVEATEKAIADGYTGYCPGAGIPELRAAIAVDVGAKRQLSYTADQVSIQPGGKPVIGKFLAAVMDPGDEVLYPNPGYPIYESQIEYLGGVAVPYGYVETASGFDLDLDAIEHGIGPRTRVLIYNNFQNPNGAESSPAEMERLAQLAIKHDLWVLSDEAYFEIQYSGQAESIVSLPGMQERSVILYTCSKRFAMTGWRLGYAAGPAELIKAINQVQSQSSTHTSSISQAASVEALNGPQDFLTERAEVFKERRDLVVKAMNECEGLTFKKPDGAGYVYPSCAGTIGKKTPDCKVIETDTDFVTYLLESEGVAAVQGSAFGLAPYFRISYATSTEALTEACARIKRACAALK